MFIWGRLHTNMKENKTFQPCYRKLCHTRNMSHFSVWVESRNEKPSKFVIMYSFIFKHEYVSMEKKNVRAHSPNFNSTQVPLCFTFTMKRRVTCFQRGGNWFRSRINRGYRNPKWNSKQGRQKGRLPIVCAQAQTWTRTHAQRDERDSRSASQTTDNSFNSAGNYSGFKSLTSHKFLMISEPQQAMRHKANCMSWH